MEHRLLWPRIEIIGTIIVLALAAASFSLALSSPVYTDEIEWKLSQGHFVDDGFTSRTMTMAPSCGPDTFSTPVLLVAIRYANSLITDSLTQPSDIRLYGLLMFLAWAGTTWLLLRNLLAPDISGQQVAAGIAATVTLGVMPLFMVFSRPEQVMLIGMSIFLLMALDERPARQRTVLQDAVLATAMIIGGAFVLGSHPKAVFLLPFVILACLRVVRRRAISFAAGAIVAIFAFVAFVDFNARLACPGDANIRNAFDPESIGIAMTDHRLGDYFQQLASVLLEKPGSFFFLTQFGFNPMYDSQMIRPYPYTGLGFALTWLLAAFVGVLAVAGMAAFVLVAVTRIRKRQGLIALAALASAWAFPLVSLVARATRHNYEAELLEPMLALVSVLSLWFAREELSRLWGQPRLLRYARTAFAALIALSIVSQIALLAGYVPIAERSWSRTGYLSRQPLSVSVGGGFPGLRDAILAAAARCGIRPGKNTRHLVVDELTFFVFRHTNTPYLMTYLHPVMWGGGIADLPRLLAEKHSSGVIVGCQWIVPQFAPVVQTRGFCCVPKF